MNYQRLERAKRAYYDHHERGLKYDEIAANMGTTRGTVAAAFGSDVFVEQAAERARLRKAS